MSKKIQISRRALLKSSAATAALSATGCSTTAVEPMVEAIENELPKSDALTGTGKWVGTTCQGCTSWCAKQVYVMDGRAVKVRGNVNSQVHGESSCPRQHLSLQQVYDPDRVRTPLIRTNPKKGQQHDPMFKPISWDEALDLLADKIINLRNAGEANKYALLRGRYSHINEFVYKHLTNMIGSPNNISHSSICAEAHKMGPYYQDGNWGYNQYDVANAKFILSFGADPIASNRQVSYYSKTWGDALDQAKVVVVDPRLSASASKAHKWIPIEPAKDSVLALAIAHVALVEGGWHKPFVGDFKDGNNQFVAGKTIAASQFDEKYTHGLIEWWNLTLKDCTPQWAAEQTDIDPQTIISIAKDMAAAAPAVQVWTSRGAVMHTRGTYTSFACHALNGLFGGIDNKGGLFPANKIKLHKSFPDSKPYLDDIAKKTVKSPKIDQRGTLAFPALKKGKSGGGVITSNAPNGMLSADPYEIKVMLAYFNNFNFSSPEGQRWNEALSQLEFMAHITTNISEFSWFADIILPANHHMFEKWGVLDSIGNGVHQVSVQQPSIDRLWNTKDDESEIPYLLAKKLAEKGFDKPWRYINEQLLDPETQQPAKNEQEFGKLLVRYVTAPLWQPGADKYGEDLGSWDKFVEAGVWNSHPYKLKTRWGKFKTETKQFEFYSKTLETALGKHAKKHSVSVDEVMAACEYEARGKLAFVPHYEAPYRFGDAKQYPLLLVDQKSRLNKEGRSANTPWYYEFKDVDPGDKVEVDTAKLNPIDAQKLGIKDGDNIIVSSPVGQLSCTAALWEGVRPGTVAKCFGQGHWAYGRHASLKFGSQVRGGNNNDIIADRYDRLSGASAFYGHIRIQVSKA
ncbi:molybdopterin-dependent oxidoreductase [Shewanella sp. Scap07]|uniref:arsenate respiratory reductase molybdopterin-containing subunit ArrA n=1 Tax=Shewanella sp. Scap07 TaxID=2589987 RepID=UPI0015BEB1DB|nr:arsenate respiratory reductase molybdopterin-containing subunit ArrA [Shewanella sp. Scap07]QLE87137.1 molybdopterin-dependent oxidoreductase [Shewanella sp. Scap07]